jgi:putative transposase
MKKAYTFRIYPPKNQEVKLNRTLITCRLLYNDALQERKRQAELNRLKRDFQVFPWGSSIKPEWISYEDQANTLSAQKTDSQREVHSQVLQNALKRLDRSFQNFFNGYGYPRFKGRNRYNTFTYPQSGFELDGMNLTLSKIGTMRIFQHREIEGKIKTCTIKRDIDQWYAIFTVDIDKKIEKVLVKTKTGVDVGLESLLTLSNGEQIEPQRFYKKSEESLAWEQKRLSRKKLGSKNRGKQKLKVAKVHRRIRNQRKDFNHKTSRGLIKTFDYIVFEDLQIKNMVQNHHMHNHRLAKSILDAGWGQIIRFTAYKAEYAGKTIELVDPYWTSQTCLCGHHVPKKLSVRIHVCPQCGLILNRYHVSAILIRNKGKSTVPTDCGELTPVESMHKQLGEAGSPIL